MVSAKCPKLNKLFFQIQYWNEIPNLKVYIVTLIKSSYHCMQQLNKLLLPELQSDKLACLLIQISKPVYVEITGRSSVPSFGAVHKQCFFGGERIQKLGGNLNKGRFVYYVRTQGMSRWLRKWQFSLTLCTANVLMQVVRGFKKTPNPPSVTVKWSLMHRRVKKLGELKRDQKVRNQFRHHLWMFPNSSS